MGYEYELITHKNIPGLQVFLVNLEYRSPHIHREFEICFFLTGEVDVRIQTTQYHVGAGSFMIVNPYQVHELQATKPAQILCIQISPSFFQNYYPQIRNLIFTEPVLNDDGSRRIWDLKKAVVDLARVYLKKKPLYELSCAARINAILYRCLQAAPFAEVSEAEAAARASREDKIRYLTEQIEERCSQKLLLSEIAEEMNLNLYYLSHFFNENFGISFQQYLAKVRCEKARKLLLLTDHSVLDISIASGFSDPKYLNSTFKKQYGCTPREYRRGFHSDPMDAQQFSMLTTQEFLSEETSLVLLERFLNEGGYHGLL